MEPVYPNLVIESWIHSTPAAVHEVQRASGEEISKTIDRSSTVGVGHEEAKNVAGVSCSPSLLLPSRRNAIRPGNGRMGSCWQGFNARTWVVPDGYVFARVICARGATYS